ncbi:MAG: hypothetical protein JWP97_5481 [Labilithrix sp.]|nr:hypothetical protein [Labilithrix sp.]
MRVRRNNHFRTTVAWLAVSGMVACSLLVACSDDDSPGSASTIDAGNKDTGAGADTSPPASDVAIRVTAKYAGTQQGPVLVSIFPTPDPSAGAPSGTGSNENPTWPGTNTVDVKNVSPGSYYAFAYVMVGASHRMGPTSTDPANLGPVPITVTAGATTAVTLELFDPPAGDAGADADAADADGG